MKKFVSVVLALTMVVSMFATASAATLGSLGIDSSSEQNPYMRFELPIEVSARLTSQGGEYIPATEGLRILDLGLKNGVSVDYKAKLDMTQIRDLFGRGFFTTTLLADPEVKAEFDAGIVTTTVEVTVSYPGVTIENASSAGSLTSGNVIFSEKSARVVGENSVKITYENKSNLTVAELTQYKDTYLADVVFELPAAAKYTKDGYHEISVSLSGTTKLHFDTTDVYFAYSNVQDSGKYVVSAATEHLLVVVPAEPATCTEGGKTEGIICATHRDYDCAVHGFIHNGYDCGINGTVEPQPTPALGHKINGVASTVKVSEVAPTCTKDGIREHYTCTLCKKDFDTATPDVGTAAVTAEALKIAKNGHSNVTIPGLAPTCTVDGYETASKCSVCGYKTGGKVIPATGHTEQTLAAVAPDCENTGKTEGKKCSVCDKILVAQTTIAATGHNFGAWNEVTPPTQDATGLKERFCQNSGCNKRETLDIPKLAHTCEVKPEAAIITQAPTCTETGLKQNYCACGQAVGDPETVPAEGHNAEKIDAVKATCTDAGLIEHYACSKCSGIFRDEACTDKIFSAKTGVDTSNHTDGNGVKNEVVLAADEPTCDEDGRSAGKKCGYCNLVIEPQTMISKAHTWELINAKSATCTDAGVAKHWHCKVCNKDLADDKLTELAVADYTIAALGHRYGDVVVTLAPQEGVPGKGKRTCTVCSDEKLVDIAPLEHIHNETVYEVEIPATCTTDGLERKKYTCCNEQYQGVDATRVIPKGHNIITIAAIAATCRTEGIIEHKFCTVCEKRFNKDTGAEITEIKAGKLDHVLGGNIGAPGEIVRECSNCGEILKIKSNTNKAKVETDDLDNKHPNKIRGDREEAMLEKDHKEADENNQKVKAESEMTINETGLSKGLEDKILNKDKAVEEKVVLDITLKAVSNFVDKNDETILYDQKKEIIKETEEFFTITINIPVSMQGKSDYRVYRMHNGAHTENDIITETENFYGEKIISKTATTVVIKVRRFSEYVLVAYTEQQPEIVYPDPNPSAPSTGGGGSSSSLSIKFNSNGGTVVDSVSVKKGGKVSDLPTPVRDGYVFGGWYLDSSFTTAFDADTVINRNYTLYAKWVALHECQGTVEDNCPCLKYYDLDPTMWYHRGVDYVLNRGMMIGVADTQFAPDWDVTRAMLVTVLWRAEGKPAGASTTFTDLEDGLYYVDAVKWAAANGVVNGYSDTVFAPNDAITREQFAAIMYRYAKNKGYDVSVGENTNILSYSDYDAISEYAIEAMQYTLGSGLIKGRTETTLNPKDNTTRAEMATILYRFFTENK